MTYKKFEREKILWSSMYHAISYLLMTLKCQILWSFINLEGESQLLCRGVRVMVKVFLCVKSMLLIVLAVCLPPSSSNWHSSELSDSEHSDYSDKPSPKGKKRPAPPSKKSSSSNKKSSSSSHKKRKSSSEASDSDDGAKRWVRWKLL